MAVTYSPRAGYAGVTGTVAYGPNGLMFNIGAALAAGGGSIVVADAELAQALDKYPALYRSADDGQALAASPAQRWTSVSVGSGLPNATDVAFEVRRAGEAFARYQVLANGSVKSGDGTVAPTVQAGAVATDDPRLSDARTPLAHSHVIADVTGLQAALNAAGGGSVSFVAQAKWGVD